MRWSRGSTLVELVAVSALLGLLLMIGAPVAVRVREGGRSAAAARNLALTIQSMRWRSVALGRGHGLWFERLGGEWVWYEVQDGNGNGVRSAELRRGVDRTLGGPYRPENRIQLGFPGAGPYPRIPPGRGVIRDLDDPVQFGRSELIGFSPLGRASSGTIYLTDGHSTLVALVLFGPSSRVRVWRFDEREARWSL